MCGAMSDGATLRVTSVQESGLLPHTVSAAEVAVVHHSAALQLPGDVMESALLLCSVTCVPAVTLLRLVTSAGSPYAQI